MIRLKSPREIAMMRNSGGMLAKSFVSALQFANPGNSSAELDQAAENKIVEAGARPAFKGYKGSGNLAFPSTVCISIDEVVVHGIPSEAKFRSGQIVGLDIGLEFEGWFADMACSVLIGETDNQRRQLWEVTRESLYIGIDKARKGNRISDIGAAVQAHVEDHGFSVIRDLVGHGIGSELHEEPSVPNYYTREARTKLKPGMTLAIEPMVAAGDFGIMITDDGWSAATKDASPTAHFEHTVLITDDAPEILTLLPDGQDPWKMLDIN